MSDLTQHEDSILSGCRRLLTFLQNKKVLVYRRVHVMPVIRGWRFRACCKSKVPVLCPNEDMAGMSDLLIWIKDGPCLSVEIKAPKGKKSPNQVEWEKKLQNMGHEYHEIKSIDELVALLKKHGVEN